jgi:hypothetical protein
LNRNQRRLRAVVAKSAVRVITPTHHGITLQHDTGMKVARNNDRSIIVDAKNINWQCSVNDSAIPNLTQVIPTKAFYHGR